MHSLRTSSALLRLVLACYLMVLGAAGASAVVHPQRMEVVCMAEGAMKMVAVDHEAGARSLDCALCLAAALPAPEFSSQGKSQSALAHALVPVVAAHVAGRTGARFPPRGPPALA